MCISSCQNIFRVYVLESTPVKHPHSGYFNHIYPVTLVIKPRCLITQSPNAQYENSASELRKPKRWRPNSHHMRWGTAVLSNKLKDHWVQYDGNSTSALKGQEVPLTKGKQMLGNRIPTKCWLQFQLFNKKMAVWSAQNSLFNCFLTLGTPRRKNS